MANKNIEQKESFWQRYKFLIIGLLGAVIFLSFFSVQSVNLSYKVGEEAYTVKMDYTMFNFCINCTPLTDNASEIVEKEVFVFSGKEDTIKRAAKSLVEIAENKEGQFLVDHSGVVGNDEELLKILKNMGYTAAPMQ